MERLGELYRRLLFLFRRDHFDADLAEEMRHHAEMTSSRQFGNQLWLREKSRDAWGWGALDRTLQDVRFAFRMLRKNATFTAVALLTLATGIGANTVIFTVVHAVLLSPLPYQQPDRLVSLIGVRPRWSKGMSAPDIADIRAQNSVFESVALAAFSRGDITAPGEPERVAGSRSSASLFSMLGVAPLLGRTLLPEDEAPDAPPVIVISYALWQRRFAGSPQAVGATLTMGKVTYTVVGVMPQWFRFPRDEGQYWLTLGPTAPRQQHLYSAIARLRPGVSLDRARAEMKTIAARLEKAYPATNHEWSADAILLTEQLVGGVRSTLFILFGAVGMVLLVACANVANLLLSRGAQRHQEMAVRAALGAGRGRLLRLLFVESLVLSLAGGAIGILAAYWSVHALTPLYPSTLPRVSEIHIDGVVLAFTTLIACAAAVIAGLLPALRVSRSDLNFALKSGSRGRGLRTGRSRAILVVAQVAMAMVLLACAGLLIKSFLLRTELHGFTPDNVLIAEVPELPEGHLPVILDRIRALPEVAAAGSTTSFSYVRMMGIDVKRGTLDVSANVEVVTPGYLNVLQVPLRKGRVFEQSDFAGESPILVINDELARRYFPQEDPIGKQVSILTTPKVTLATIVGVVGDVAMGHSDEPGYPAIYLPFRTTGVFSMFQPDSIAIRTTRNVERVAPAVRQIIRAMEPKAPIVRLQTMKSDLATRVAGPRFYTMLLGLFASIALLLAALGVYGVMSVAVSLRTHEIGVRVAMGASRANVLRSVMREAGLLAIAGVTLGGAAAYLATKLLTTTELLYAVKPHDPLTFAIVPGVLLLAAMGACLPAARRATRISPMEALRYE